jgi:hypothetical protein
MISIPYNLKDFTDEIISNRPSDLYLELIHPVGQPADERAGGERA